MVYGKFLTDDPSRFEVALRPWDVMLKASRNGEQALWLEYFHLPGLMVYRESYSHEVRLTGMPPPGRLAITVSSGETGGSAFYGSQIQNNQLYALTGDVLDSHYCAGFSQLVIEVDLEHKFHGSMALTVEKLASRNRCVSFAKSATHAASLYHVLDKGLRLASDQRHSAHSSLNRILSTEIEHALCRSVLHDDSDKVGGNSTGQNAAVVAMLEYLRTLDAECVSVSALCRNIGVNERTLERGVRAQFDTTVVRFLREWRLHDARRQIVSLDASHGKVSDVAMGLGFFDLGRFASSYHSLFGEYPSTTLNSVARNNAPQLTWK